MSAPTHLECCRGSQYDKEIHRFHDCMLEAGHEGPHECHCGVEWENTASIRDATGEP